MMMMTYWGAQTPSAADADVAGVCRRRRRLSPRLSCDVCKAGGPLVWSMVGCGVVCWCGFIDLVENAIRVLRLHAAQGNVRSVDSVDVVLERHSCWNR